MPAPIVDVSIVIGSRENLIDGCLASLDCAAKQTPVRVVVTANPATTDTIDRVEHGFPSVRVVRNSCRLGFAKNHNRSLKSSRAKYVLILNDDTVLHEGAVDNAVEYMESEPECAIVGAKLLNEDSSYQESVFGAPRLWQTLAVFIGKLFPMLKRPTLHRIYRRAYMGRESFGSRTEACSVPAVKGAFMLVRREVVEQAGLIDEVTEVYEEIEWQHRFRACGFSIGYLPSAIVTHFGAATVGGYSWTFVEQVKSAYNYYDKHSSGIVLATFRAAMITVIVACVLNPIMAPSRRKLLLAALSSVLFPREWILKAPRYWSDVDERRRESFGGM